MLESFETGSSGLFARVEIGRHDNWKLLGAGQGQELSVISASLHGLAVPHGIRWDAPSFLEMQCRNSWALSYFVLVGVSPSVFLYWLPLPPLPFSYLYCHSLLGSVLCPWFCEPQVRILLKTKLKRMEFWWLLILSRLEVGKAGSEGVHVQAGRQVVKGRYVQPNTTWFLNWLFFSVPSPSKQMPQ